MTVKGNMAVIQVLVFVFAFDPTWELVSNTTANTTVDKVPTRVEVVGRGGPRFSPMPYLSQTAQGL